MEARAAAKSIILLHSETLSGFNSIYGYAENSAYIHVRRQGTLAEHGKTNMDKRMFEIYDATNFSLKL